MSCPFELLEEASTKPVDDTDDLEAIQEAIVLRFSKDNIDQPIGDELLDAILQFIQRD